MVLRHAFIPALLTLIPHPGLAQMNPWQLVLPAAYIHDMAITPPGPAYAVSFTGGVWRSDNSGVTWAPLTSPATDLVAVAGTPAGHVYVGTWGHGVFRSTDNGTTWGATGPSISLKVTRIAANVSGDVFIATFGDSALYRSTDSGNSWLPKTKGIPFQSDPIHLDALAPGPSGLLYAAADIVYRSTNNGDDWTPIGPPSSENILGLLWVSPGHVYTGGLGGVRRTTDDGATWQTVNFGANPQFVRCLAATPKGKIFRGTSFSGIYYTDDGGDNWYDFNSGLTDMEVFALAAAPDGHLLAGGHAQGVWRTATPLAVRQASGTILRTTELFQNYPNPFNPTTTIQFGIGNRELVTLKVFDLLGREVAALVDGMMEAGAHEVTFDASGLASGMYICRLQTEGFTQSRTLQLIR